jgi:tetraprenyl-beta-curcumene synthase
VSVLTGRWFVARAGLALVYAQVRYWLRVAPLVRSELRRWEARAAEIVDPVLRGLALEKLRDEGFNAETVAIIATTAPVRYRERAVEAIVALQVMFDYLDALTEQPTANPIRDGLQVSQALTDAVSVSVQSTVDYYAYHPGPGDTGYLAELTVAVRAALRCLPAWDAVADVILARVSDCAEAQVRMHAAPHAGIAQLERWAAGQAHGTQLQWREWVFGSMASVVATHALIAAAAEERTTRELADEIDSTYLSICFVTTALDHLVDHERDTLKGDQNSLHLYESREVLAQQIAAVTDGVLQRARTLPNGPHHAMILAGVVAYYTSQPSAMREFARPVTERAREKLGALITPTLAIMRVWRLAKRVRGFARALFGADRGRWLERLRWSGPES